MAKVLFHYEEGEDEGFKGELTYTFTNDGINDLDDLLYFLGNAIRGSGYTYVDRIGWSTDKGEIKWAPF